MAKTTAETSTWCTDNLWSGVPKPSSALFRRLWVLFLVPVRVLQHRLLDMCTTASRSASFRLNARRIHIASAQSRWIMFTQVDLLHRIWLGGHQGRGRIFRNPKQFKPAVTAVEGQRTYRFYGIRVLETWTERQRKQTIVAWMLAVTTQIRARGV